MRPVILSLFGIDVPAYFAMLSVGFALATWIGARQVAKLGLDREVIIDLGLAMVIAGVAGSRVLHVIADGYFWDYVHLCTDPAAVDWKIDRSQCTEGMNRVWDAAKGVCHPAPKEMVDKVSLCFSWAKFWAGGLTYYGGFIGASAAAVWLLKHDKFPVWKACDMAGIVVPLGLGFGRRSPPHAEEALDATTNTERAGHEAGS